MAGAWADGGDEVSRVERLAYCCEIYRSGSDTQVERRGLSSQKRTDTVGELVRARERIRISVLSRPVAVETKSIWALSGIRQQYPFVFELSIFVRQCLGHRRLSSVEALALEVAAWASARDAAGGTVEWQFTTEDARVKLHRLYPSV